MILLLIAWFTTISIFFGFGYLLLTIFKLKPVKFSEIALVGFLVLTALCALFSLFIPLNGWFSFSVMAVGLMACVHSLKCFPWLQAFKSLGKMERYTIFFLPLPILIYSLSEISYYDTGLYHAQAIKWIQQYAVVPGLGNLHGRFAFNSNLFITSAVFSFKINNAIVYPVNTVLFFIFFLNIAEFIKTKLKSEEKTGLWALILASFIILFVFPTWINLPSPDFTSAFLIIFITKYFFEYDNAFSLYSILLILGLSLIAITIKLSNIIFLLFPVAAFVNYVSYNRTRLWQKTLIFFGAVLVIMVPWVIRNVILSGYLIYPYTFFDWIDVDWKIPTPEVVVEKNIIEAYGKIHGGDDSVLKMTFSEWFPIWFYTKSILTKILLVGSLLIFYAMYQVAKKRQFMYLLTLVFTLISLIIWFVVAPSPRFVFGQLFISFSFGLTLVLMNFKKVYHFFTYNNVLAVYICISVVSVFLSYKSLSSALTGAALIYPRPMPEAQLQKVRSANVEYHFAKDSRCWDAALPCAEKEVCIELRGKTLQQGFRSTSQPNVKAN